MITVGDIKSKQPRAPAATSITQQYMVQNLSARVAGYWAVVLQLHTEVEAIANPPNPERAGVSKVRISVGIRILATSPSWYVATSGTAPAPTPTPIPASTP